jgi:Flp pilus assembly CpaF family ATPase
VTDVEVNPDGRCWAKRFSRGWEATDLHLLATDRRMILDLLASRQMAELSDEWPSLNTVLPGGARIEGTIEPLSDAPTFAIRIEPLCAEAHRFRGVSSCKDKSDAFEDEICIV